MFNKKVLIFLVLLLVVSVNFCHARKQIKITEESVVTISTTAIMFNPPDNGYLEVFSHGKIYISLTGDTPNVGYRYIDTGKGLDTEAFYYVTDEIGMLASSGTITVNFTVYDLED